MFCRLALLTLLAAVSACDAPPPGKESMRPAAQNKPAPAAPSKRPIAELSEQCENASRDQFRRDWQDGVVPTQDGPMTADFANHYNAKLDTCFYLLTLSHTANGKGQAGASASTLTIKLFDINDGELYGEYSGPAAAGSPAARLPVTCRVESMYCASKGEWEVLLEPYMKD